MLITRSELANILSTAYWSAFAIALVILLLITFKVSRTAKGRTIGSLVSLLVVVGVFSIPFIPKSPNTQEAEQNAERHNTSLSETGEAPFHPVAPTKSNYKIAKALFDEKCKTAGEKIYRTVDNVEGVTLLRVPKPYKNAYAYDPMWEEAALKMMSNDYLKVFLGITYHNKVNGYYHVYWKPEKNEKIDKEKYNPMFGYSYVDVKENEKFYRYTLNPGHRAEKNKTPIETPSRYAITYESKIDPNERKYWIATTVLIVLDTQTNEVLGEKTLVIFDHGLGGGARGTSGRQPWSFALQCNNETIQGNTPRFFAEKVLKPKQPNFNTNNGE